MSNFTLVDTDHILDREDHPTLTAAIHRANTTPWTNTRWQVYGPNGQLAATPTRRAQ